MARGNSKSDNEGQVLAKMFASSDYNRARMHPHPHDRMYFHLKDLVDALKSVSIEPNSKILDYGCGSSPYKDIFSQYVFHKADYPYDGVAIDYQIVNGRVPEARSEVYDYVLSSQVLEHVPSVNVYLREAWRVLKSQGKLILTTHGIFEDHPCPLDLWRWTADGLKLEVERCGFEAIRVVKLTGGKRFAFMQLEQSLRDIGNPGTSVGAICLRAFRRIFLWRREQIARDIENDSAQSGAHLVTTSDAGPKKYVAIMIVARKVASAG